MLTLGLIIGLVGASVSAQEIKTAFIPQLIGIPYFSAMENGGNDAAEEFGVEFNYTGPTETSAQAQVEIMESLIQQEYDAISISVLDPDSINPTIANARDEGIAVLTSDSDSPNSERQAFVAQARSEELGYTLIDELAEQIDGSGKIGIVSGEATATNLNTWIEFMEERVAEEYPEMEIVDIRYTAGGSAEDAFRQSQQLMIANPDLKGLVAVASTTIPGVARAVSNMNKTGEVMVTGYGSPNTVREYIKSGVMETSILWNPYELGYLTVWAMKQHAEGNELQEENEVPGLDRTIRYFPEDKTLLLGPPLVITEDNVDDFNF